MTAHNPDTREKLLEIAERCEKATGPDRAIDAGICELIELPLCVEPDCLPDVLRKIIGRARNGDEPFGPDEECPLYTASLDAAMTLVPEGWRAGFEENARCDEPGKSYAWVWPFESSYDPDWQMGQEGQQSNPDAQKGYAATPALALCAAALRARNEQVTK